MRIQHDLSQQEVADKVGVSREYYRLIEAGKRQKHMDLTLITRFAEAFDENVYEILAAEMEYSAHILS